MKCFLKILFLVVLTTTNGFTASRACFGELRGAANPRENKYLRPTSTFLHRGLLSQKNLTNFYPCTSHSSKRIEPLQGRYYLGPSRLSSFSIPDPHPLYDINLENTDEQTEIETSLTQVPKRIVDLSSKFFIRNLSPTRKIYPEPPQVDIHCMNDSYALIEVRIIPHGYGVRAYGAPHIYGRQLKEDDIKKLEKYTERVDILGRELKNESCSKKTGGFSRLEWLGCRKLTIEEARRNSPPVVPVNLLPEAGTLPVNLLPVNPPQAGALPVNLLPVNSPQAGDLPVNLLPVNPPQAGDLPVNLLPVNPPQAGDLPVNSLQVGDLSVNLLPVNSPQVDDLSVNLLPVNSPQAGDLSVNLLPVNSPQAGDLSVNLLPVNPPQAGDLSVNLLPVAAEDHPQAVAFAQEQGKVKGKAKSKVEVATLKKDMSRKIIAELTGIFQLYYLALMILTFFLLILIFTLMILILRYNFKLKFRETIVKELKEHLSCDRKYEGAAPDNYLKFTRTYCLIPFSDQLMRI